MAMKLAPNKDKFMEVISGTGDIKADIEKFCTTFYPFLKENHDFLVWPSFIRTVLLSLLSAFNDNLPPCLRFLQASVGLDDMKAS